MVIITVKGHEIKAVTIRDSFSRRAVQYKNDIIASLRKLGLTANDLDFEPEVNAIRKAPASVSWYFSKRNLHYSHFSQNKYVENLYIVSKVIDLEVTALIEERITLEEFIHEFQEDAEVAKKRKEARLVLGLDHDVNDAKVIDKAYKHLAKKYHPDTDSGNTEKFKEINQAHHILKKELI